MVFGEVFQGQRRDPQSGDDDDDDQSPVLINYKWYSSDQDKVAAILERNKLKVF